MKTRKRFCLILILIFIDEIKTITYKKLNKKILRYIRKFDNIEFCNIKIDDIILTREIEKLKKTIELEQVCISLNFLITFKFCIRFSKKLKI